jgi:predicted alpha/beta superfamily hydrolase
MYPQQYPASLPSSNQTGLNSLQQTDDERMRKFQYIVDRYEINREFATRLRALEGYEIVFIVDGKILFNILKNK